MTSKSEGSVFKIGYVMFTLQYLVLIVSCLFLASFSFLLWYRHESDTGVLGWNCKILGILQMCHLLLYVSNLMILLLFPVRYLYTISKIIVELLKCVVLVLEIVLLFWSYHIIYWTEEGLRYISNGELFEIKVFVYIYTWLLILCFCCRFCGDFLVSFYHSYTGKNYVSVGKKIEEEKKPVEKQKPDVDNEFTDEDDETNGVGEEHGESFVITDESSSIEDSTVDSSNKDIFYKDALDFLEESSGVE